MSFLIIWLVLASAIASSGLTIAKLLYDEYQEVGASERERLASQAKVIGDNIGDRLDATKRALVNIRSRLPDWQKLPDGMIAASNWLQALDEALSIIRTINILDERGVVVASSRVRFIRPSMLVGTEL